MSDFVLGGWDHRQTVMTAVPLGIRTGKRCNLINHLTLDQLMQGPDRLGSREARRLGRRQAIGQARRQQDCHHLPAIARQSFNGPGTRVGAYSV